MKRRVLTNTAIVAAAAAGLIVYGSHRADVAAQQPARPAAKAGSGAMVPQFQYDKSWPKPLPNVMKVGHVVAVSVDSRDHIWILQRPTTLKPSEMEASELGNYGNQKGPVSGCCRPAPPVIEFDQQGNMV